MANSAFFVGLMIALPNESGNVETKMSFNDAKSNFVSTARFGLKSQIVWLEGKSYNVRRLILEKLLPLARRGLLTVGIDANHIDRYLGVLEERVSQNKTGADWMLKSLSNMNKRAKPNVRMRTLTEAMKKNQEKGDPLHSWDLAEIPEGADWIDSFKTVEQFMSTDLFTVRPEDVIDLAASLMHWKHIRHIPVEDDAGRLIGIISHRDLLEMFVQGKTKGGSDVVIREIMKPNPISICPETSSLEALRLMRTKNIGCLPVLKDKRLVGIITAYGFLTVSVKLFEECLNASDPVKTKSAK